MEIFSSTYIPANFNEKRKGKGKRERNLLWDLPSFPTVYNGLYRSHLPFRKVQISASNRAARARSSISVAHSPSFVIFLMCSFQSTSEKWFTSRSWSSYFSSNSTTLKLQWLGHLCLIYKHYLNRKTRSITFFLTTECSSSLPDK